MRSVWLLVHRHFLSTVSLLSPVAQWNDKLRILFVLQHDEGSNCGNLGSTGGKGRYLMFPHATDEVRENNDKLSPCSIQHISSILNLKKDECFVGEKRKEHPLACSGQMFILSNVLTFRGCGCLCFCVYLCVHGFSSLPVSDQPICGNQIVEDGEECDVGHNDTDLCCFSAKQPVAVQCRLKPGKVCRYQTLTERP